MEMMKNFMDKWQGLGQGEEYFSVSGLLVLGGGGGVCS